MPREQNSITSSSAANLSSAGTSGYTSHHPPSDFWSELGKVHEDEMSARSTASSGGAPLTSILKVCSHSQL